MRVLVIDPDPGMRYSISNPSGFINQPEDQALRPGMFSILQSYADDGWTIFAISNQAGIGEGKMSYADGEGIMGKFLELAPMVEGFLYAPTMDGSECLWKPSVDGEVIAVHEMEQFKGWNFRQKAPGMIDVIKTFYAAESILAVGSRLEDEQCAKAAKVPYKTIDEWFTEWEGLTAEPKLDADLVF